MPLVRGRVIDANGHPAADARVMIVSGPAPAPDIALMTDEGGGFALDLPCPGHWTLVVASDVASARTTLEVGPEGAQPRIALPAA